MPLTTDAEIADLLNSVRTIALVGASPKQDRPSWRVMGTLLHHGYRVIPINPGLAGQAIHGQTVVGALSDIAEPIDMVDIFRNSDAALEISRGSAGAAGMVASDFETVSSHSGCVA